MPAVRRPAVRRIISFAAALGLLVPLAWTLQATLAEPEAVAATATTKAKTKTKVTPKRTLSIAKAQRGKPYRLGATGPSAFDCSGLVRYVMKKQQKAVPRTAHAQYTSKTVKKVRKSDVKRGDLIFFRSGGRVYHVGIYAGHRRIWHAPRPGKKVSLAKIWTSQYKVGRVVA